ncbi:MAG TPA: NAD(+) synthase, partial [Acidobacteriota bacterium]|nr:NAD(+) synthase [Acidobacteriota bacterium]
MKLRVAMAQINPKSGDLSGNAEKIVEGLQWAREREAELVVFPEMCLPGYCLDEKLLINLRFLRENRRVLDEVVTPACRGLTAVVGFVDFDEARGNPGRGIVRYNAAAVVEDGRVVQIVHKRLLPAYRYFDDKRYFEPGRSVEPVEFSTRKGKCSLGVLICEDLWEEGYELKPSRILKGKGAQILVCVSASPFVASTPGERNGKRFVREELLRRQIDLCGLPMLFVNTVGVGDNGKNVIPFDGFSVAFGRDGGRAAQLKAFEEDRTVIEFSDGRAPEVAEPPFDREEEIYRALVMSVRDYYEKVGIFQGVLEAVSGGVDSALGSVIACDAVGSERLSLYNLPSKFNSEQTRSAARKLAENLGVEFRVVPIQGIVDRVIEDFEKHLHPIRRSTTVENLQARIRGLIMMAESNDREALLLANGNETEIALGYATLYGDMVGGLAVIGDLPKPDVYRLAGFVNERWGREIIPGETLTMPASAELKEGQVDPFDYDVVGPILSDFVEKGFGPEEVEEMFRRRSLPVERYGLRERNLY